MPLVKSPILTAAKLAANRANARKSAGPRTPQGKRKIVLNGLKHGRYSRDFRANLVKVGADAELFDWIRARVFACFLPVGPHLCWDAERLAREVWCRVCWANRSRASLRALRRALRQAADREWALIALPGGRQALQDAATHWTGADAGSPVGTPLLQRDPGSPVGTLRLQEDLGEVRTPPLKKTAAAAPGDLGSWGSWAAHRPDGFGSPAYAWAGRVRRRKASSKVSLWSLAWTPWRFGGLEVKPRYDLKSIDRSVTKRLQIRILDARKERRLLFWVRRPRRRSTRPLASFGQPG